MQPQPNNNDNDNDNDNLLSIGVAGYTLTHWSYYSQGHSLNISFLVKLF